MSDRRAWPQTPLSGLTPVAGRRGALLAVLLACLCLTWAGVGAAQGRSTDTSGGTGRLRLGPVGGSWLLEAGIFLPIAAGLYGGARLIPQNRSGWSNTPHPYNQSADRASDFTGAYLGAAAAGLLGTGLEAVVQKGDRQAWMSTMAVAAEGGFITLGAVEILKRLVGRCRPFALSSDGKCDPSLVPSASSEGGIRTYRALPSGHVSGVAGITGGLVGLAMRTALRGDQAALRWVGAGAAAGLTSVTMGLRVRAGAHSWSDTLTAAGLGLGIGIAVAWLHPLEEARESADPQGATAGASWRWQVRPTGLTLGGAF